MPEVIYRLRIRGLVQGVFYRRSMVEQAQALGVRGWVRNRLDGSVESVVAGDPGAVEQLIELPELCCNGVGIPALRHMQEVVAIKPVKLRQRLIRRWNLPD